MLTNSLRFKTGSRIIKMLASCFGIITNGSILTDVATVFEESENRFYIISICIDRESITCGKNKNFTATHPFLKNLRQTCDIFFIKDKTLSYFHWSFSVA